MRPVLLLLTLLNNGRAAPALEGDDPTFSALRGRRPAAAVVGGACDRLRCHAGMMDELVDELRSLDIRATYYLMAEGDAACSREWATRSSYVTLVPPPVYTETNAVPWHWRGRAEFQLLNGEAARTRRFKHMAFLRNLLLEDVMRNTKFRIAI